MRKFIQYAPDGGFAVMCCENEPDASLLGPGRKQIEVPLDTDTANKLIDPETLELYDIPTEE